MVMYFDDAYSKYGKRVGVLLKSLLDHMFKFSYIVEFEITNNVEVILLGLELAKDLKINLLSIKGYSDLVILQVKNKFACKNERLRKYRNVVWDTMNFFMHLILRLSLGRRMAMLMNLQ